ncbi:hypothetical protein ES332_D08G002500v1 [Gossypium tomentosum]|uniref:DEUBAD domain-containing protein n=1 Tax=Gossypium tomentosum TaxID=34277 RepID=A0A5D2JNZ6_GOSTO|nr:hypothetical protein ES332_D08G002500v1 [Gossypium tomentosum]TYH56224.1 hypothetical protein ES332_D08G002500v1 [Gossypium tomentosum]
MMAIEKNNFKVSRFDSEFSSDSRDTTSSTDEDELQRPSSAINSDGAGDDDDEDDDDDEFDDADSGAGSDDFDLLELGEMGAEFCQVGNSTCSVPFDLYDLPGLEDILSLDVWNECLSDEERFSLTKFLPDMDQDTFMWTLNDLLKGNNFHFGSPIKKLFDILKGGLCEPRVALYREGLNFFQKRRHYHHLRMHQNNMVAKLCQTRYAWLNCRGYSIEERLRVLNIMRSQKILVYEKLEDEDSESSERGDFGEGLWSKRVKDQKALQKKGHHGVGPTLESVSRGQMVGLEPSEYRKQNPKGILKARGSKIPSAKEFGGGVYQGLDIDTEPYGLHGTLPQHKCKSGAANRTRDQMRLDDDGDPMFGTSIQQDRHAVHDSKSLKSGLLRAGKKYGLLRGEELAGDSFMALPLSSKHDSRAYGRNRNVNQFPDAKVYKSKPPNMRTPYDFAKTSKYSENHQQFAVGNQIKLMKGRTPQLPLKGSRFDLSERTELFWQNKNQGEDFSVDSSVRSDDWNIRSRKCKMGPECPDKASLQHMNDRFLFSDNRIKSSQEKIRGNNVQNGPLMAVSKGSRAFLKNEETESDSSEQFDDDDDSNPLMRSKFDYPSGVMEGSRLSSLKSGLDSRKIKSSKKDTMEDGWPLDGINRISEKSFGENVYVPGVESYYFKGKQKSKMHEISPLQNSASRALGKFDRKKVSKLSKTGQLGEKLGDRLKTSSTKPYPTEKRLKGEVVYDHPMSQRDYLLNYPVDEEDASPVTLPLADENNRRRTGKKGRSIETYDCGEKPEASLLGCKTGKEYVGDVDRRGEDGNLQSNLQKRTDDSLSLKKKGKRKLEVDAVTSDMEALEPHGAEVQVTDVEMEIKPQKKPFTLITPTVHTGFSFSIIHLLSAVRMGMITPLPEDSLEVGRPRREQNGKQEGGVNGVLSCENTTTDNPDQPVQRSIPSLTVQEIVNRVTVNPGDPCILETQEPLQDLVRGVLKSFSSKTAPLGAKGWKALVAYEKSTKSWYWVGPIMHSSIDHETIEEMTSPEAWGLPHKMLVKLVDSFANWLKNGQETLQQIGSLPAPPLELMQVNLDEKERFRDLRAQKSLNTIGPSSEEVRAYFRREELLRYSIPDRAFSYTAADGKKSIVAPLRRGGGKPTSKARDHFMLKRDRPPHVTILCLVRDAASRLPGSIGTRADVCTLIRDSQYIVEEVSDAQVNQIVSGALDRLHYERDPCVQFDGERKLWVYLHREREEEDFEDDGTSSTKKWKRQKKDTAEQSDQGAVIVAFHATGNQLGFDDDKKMETECEDRQNPEDNADDSHALEQGHPITWEPLDANLVQEDKLLCQENSTNEEFDDN